MEDRGYYRDRGEVGGYYRDRREIGGEKALGEGPPGVGLEQVEGMEFNMVRGGGGVERDIGSYPPFVPHGGRLQVEDRGYYKDRGGVEWERDRGAGPSGGRENVEGRGYNMGGG